MTGITELRRLIKASLRRGAVQVTVSLRNENLAAGFRVNRDLLNELIALAKQAEADHGVSFTLDGLLAVRGVIETEEREPDGAAKAALIEALMRGAEQAVAGLAAMRLAEGRHLADAIEDKLGQIERLTQAAEARATQRSGLIRERITALVAEALDSDTRIDRDRLEQEIAHVLVKADIREEIERLIAHIAAARDLLATGRPVGRRLDFLCQEFNREANTLGAKAGDPALTALALDLKTVIDQMREQVQNIE